MKINALYDTMVTPLSIDVSTGDVITPGAVLYEFGGIFDEEARIRLWGYNIETVMAEKVETILSRGVFNTRPRDYYDAYILPATQKYDKRLFEKALNATAEHRGSSEIVADRVGIIERISESVDLQNMWEKYRQKFPYAREIEYDDIMKSLRELVL